MIFDFIGKVALFQLIGNLIKVQVFGATMFDIEGLLLTMLIKQATILRFSEEHSLYHHHYKHVMAQLIHENVDYRFYCPKKSTQHAKYTKYIINNPLFFNNFGWKIKLALKEYIVIGFAASLLCMQYLVHFQEVELFSLRLFRGKKTILVEVTKLI